MSFVAELKRRNVLRVAAAYVAVSWLLVQVVETVFPAFGFSDAAIRLVVIVLGIGFVPAMVFAWVFEITPDGLKKERDIDRGQSITPRTGRKLDRIIMVALALALGYFAFDKFVLSESREATIAQSARQEGRSEALVESYGDRSIAVLPFVDMSPDNDQEYFSDGISEELLNLLAKIPELRVISRSSAFSYKGKDVKLAEVARELNVAHILEGSVRKAGERVRITAQLIEARSDTHLWSETYDRTLDDIFAVQDEIAAEVVEQLRIQLLDEVPTIVQTDPAAYALFLRARHLRRQTSADSLAQAEELLRQVLANDPDYLPAIDELITVHINQAHSGSRSFDEGYNLARALTLRGLQIDADSSRMLSQMGWIKAFYDNDLATAAALFERALTLTPNDPTLIGDASTIMMLLGRLDQAIILNEAILSLDPVHPVAYYNLGLELAYVGRFVDAITALRTGLKLSPDYSGGQFYLGVALLLGTDDAEAPLNEIQKETSEGYRLAGLALAQHALGNTAASDAALNTLIERYAADFAVIVAQVFAYRGETDAAFEWLDKAIEQGHPEIAELNVTWLLDNLQDDPRWLATLESLGQSPEQLANISFDVHLPQHQGN